jgi:endonuclease YncB( thermonuclease family)
MLLEAMSFIRRAALALLLLTATPAWAEELRGRVVAIHDGDTLTILTAERRQVKVRLAEIDTPESRQPYGTRARQALAAMVARRDARVVVIDTDRYGRTVGRVYVGPLDVNRELVRQGAAWVYRRYLHDRTLLVGEAEARTARRGLWSLPERDQVPPWVWRQQRGAGKT